MYPVIPGVGGVALGTPMFPRALIRLGDGRSIEVLAKGKGIFVQRITLNRRGIRSPWLPLKAFNAHHNILIFELGEQPNKEWGAQPGDAPPSFDEVQ